MTILFWLVYALTHITQTTNGSRWRGFTVNKSRAFEFELFLLGFHGQLLLYLLFIPG